MASTFLQIVQGLLKIFCGSPSQSDQGQQAHGGPPQEVPGPPSHQTQPQAQPPSQQPIHGYKPPYPVSPRPQQGDQNQLNQHNERYMSLRSRANAEGDQMAQAFEGSHAAYGRGDGALAKELSNKGKEHKMKMESLNREASDWIFIENNKDSKPGEIDLHGLYVREAIAHTDQAIQQAKQRGDSEVRLIVGKGLHSPGGAAKIKPAIEELIRKNRLVAEIDPDNAGVLIVRMDQGGQPSRGSREVGVDEITRRLQKEDEGCVIM